MYHEIDIPVEKDSLYKKFANIINLRTTCEAIGYGLLDLFNQEIITCCYNSDSYSTAYWLCGFLKEHTEPADPVLRDLLLRQIIILLNDWEYMASRAAQAERDELLNIAQKTGE